MGSVLLAALFIALQFAIGKANPDSKRLYDDLLSNYNRLIRPVGNNSDRLTVKMGLRLSQLIDVVSIRGWFEAFRHDLLLMDFSSRFVINYVAIGPWIIIINLSADMNRIQCLFFPNHLHINRNIWISFLSDSQCLRCVAQRGEDFFLHNKAFCADIFGQSLVWIRANWINEKKICGNFWSFNDFAKLFVATLGIKPKSFDFSVLGNPLNIADWFQNLWKLLRKEKRFSNHIRRIMVSLCRQGFRVVSLRA